MKLSDDLFADNLESLKKRIRTDPVFARNLLVEARIVDLNGNLTEPYRDIGYHAPKALLPCPCGNKANLDAGPYAITSNYYRLDCDTETEGANVDCGWCVIATSPEQCFEDWNRRDEIAIWQPFNTAPKDGSEIILFGKYRNGSGTDMVATRWSTFSSMGNAPESEYFWSTSGLGTLANYDVEWLLWRPMVSAPDEVSIIEAEAGAMIGALMSKPSPWETNKCPDNLLPDGEVCPRCGGRRSPSGVDGGSWVHY